MGRKRKAGSEEKQQNNKKQQKNAEQSNVNETDVAKKNNVEGKKDGESFSWTDDEIQLLLMTALDYKSQCEFEGINWESKRSKYEQIFELMMKQYPSGDNDNYPNKNSLNKDRITAKLKGVRTGFKKAVDAGKKSGGGRVVFTFYNLCLNLWGGSPAVTSLPSGVDTSGQGNSFESDDESLSPSYFPQETSQESILTTEAQGEPIDVEYNEEQGQDKNDRKTTGRDNDLSKLNTAATERRQEVTNMLRNRKDKKMATKLSADSQLLQISRDDLSFKKELLEKINESDKEFKASFNELNRTMATIGSAIQQSVGILGQMVGGVPNQAGIVPPQTYRYPQTYQYHQVYQSQSPYQSGYPESSTITNPNNYAASGDDDSVERGIEKEYQNL